MNALQQRLWDEADMRDTFPGKAPETYDERTALKRLIPERGTSRVYVINGDMPGVAADGEESGKFVNVYQFWEPAGADKKEKRKNRAIPDQVKETWKALAEAASGVDRAEKEVPLDKGIDLEGGSSFLVRINPQEGRDVNEDVRQQAIGIIERRLNNLGGKDLLIAPQGEDMILVQMPGIDEEQRDFVRETIKRTAVLDFRIVHQNSAAEIAKIDAGEIVEPGWTVLPVRNPDGEDGVNRYLVKRRPDLTGEFVKDAFPTLQPDGWHINLGFDSKGADRFGKLTAANVGRQLAVVLDKEVVSAPVLREAIWGGQCDISGQFEEAEARGLASALENPLQNPLDIENEHSVDPTLGADAVKQGILAGIAGLSLTLVFLVLYYRFAGLVALLGLAINILLLFGAMVMFDFTLTLPGIAGIILTIGIAIDANVLIYERLKEELGLGKSLTGAIRTAYEKAFTAIFDANITTLITAFILFWVARGPVKGFAVTLITGVLGSM
ncbi:MAG: protein translocase subunit SecD, partial [Verrucomicrobiota bacterium]